MNVRVMRMLVRDWFVPVRVRMRFAAIPIELMGMLMMFVMRMSMLMLDRLVRVFMLMRLSQVQPDAEGHQRTGPPEMRAR